MCNFGFMYLILSELGTWHGLKEFSCKCVECDDF